MYNLSERSKNRLSGVHPFLVDTINMAISKSPEDFGYTIKEEQQKV